MRWALYRISNIQARNEDGWGDGPTFVCTDWQYPCNNREFDVFLLYVPLHLKQEELN
jgi:hypothetical protein